MNKTQKYFFLLYHVLNPLRWKYQQTQIFLSVNPVMFSKSRSRNLMQGILHRHVSNCTQTSSVSVRRVLSVTVRLSRRSFQSSIGQTTAAAEAEMIRSLSLLRYSLNVSQRAHVRLLSSSRGVGKRIVPATFTGGTCLIYLTWTNC